MKATELKTSKPEGIHSFLLDMIGKGGHRRSYGEYKRHINLSKEEKPQFKEYSNVKIKVIKYE